MPVSLESVMISSALCMIPLITVTEIMCCVFTVFNACVLVLTKDWHGKNFMIYGEYSKVIINI